MTETAKDCVERTRREQGLPPKIADVLFYDRLAAGYVDADKPAVSERKAA